MEMKSEDLKMNISYFIVICLQYVHKRVAANREQQIENTYLRFNWFEEKSVQNWETFGEFDKTFVEPYGMCSYVWKLYMNFCSLLLFSSSAFRCDKTSLVWLNDILVKQKLYDWMRESQWESWLSYEWMQNSKLVIKAQLYCVILMFIWKAIQYFVRFAHFVTLILSYYTNANSLSVLHSFATCLLWSLITWIVYKCFAVLTHWRNWIVSTLS